MSVWDLHGVQISPSRVWQELGLLGVSFQPFLYTGQTRHCQVFQMAAWEQLTRWLGSSFYFTFMFWKTGIVLYTLLYLASSNSKS